MPDDWQEDVLEGWLGRRRDGRWSASTCGLAVPRQNGKNGIIEVRELFGMVALGEKFLHTAHEVKTARKAFRRIASFFDADAGASKELAGMVAEIRKTNGQEAVLLTNGGSVEFIARSRGSGRGYTVDVLVLDEAQDLKDDELEALLPTISASPTGNPQVILTGTPPDPDKGQTGEVFTRVRAESQSDPRAAWTDFGAADGPLPDIDDRDAWATCNPTLGIRLHVNEIERERKMMSPEGFARERLGWWGDPSAVGSQLFASDAWGNCATHNPPDAPGAIGLAVSIDRSFASIGAATNEPEPHLGSVKRGRGLAWVVDEVVRICENYKVPVAIDGKGPGSDLIPEIEARGVTVLATSTTEYLDACAWIFDAVTEGTVWHGDYDDLNEAVRVAAKRSVGDRFAFGRKGGDVSMLEAVTLARWGAHQEVSDPEPSAFFL